MQVAWKPIVLVMVGLVLLAFPIFAPPESVLEHDTGEEWGDFHRNETNVTLMEEFHYDVYQYGNLSDRAQTLYVKALKNGGKFTVSKGEGAPEFQYPSRDEILEDRDNVRKTMSMNLVAIIRPNDSSLPPADEPEGFRQVDRMSTTERRPGLLSTARVPHLLAILSGTSLIGTGGYMYIGRPDSIELL